MTLTLLYAYLSIVGAGFFASAMPGPSFSIVLRNSVKESRKAGLVTTLGLAVGLLFYIAVVISGLAILYTKYPSIMSAIKILGGLYLLYLGVIFIKISRKNSSNDDIEGDMSVEVAHSNIQFFYQGFIANITNPNIILFVGALFMHVTEMPLSMQIFSGISLTIVDIIWFSMVAVFLTQKKMMSIYKNKIHVIETIAGVILILAGINILVSALFFCV